MKVILIALVFLGFFSCSSKKVNRAEPIWIGKTKHELIEKYGLPNEKQSDGQGGQIYVYKKAKGAKIYGSDESQVIQVNKVFYMDNSGKIYQIKVD